MKKVIRAAAAFWAGALGLGFLVSAIERKIKQGRQEKMRIHRPFGAYEKYFKRPLDFALSLTAIILLAPVLLSTGIAVRLKLGRPVIFKQLRPGENEQIFEMYKFRSMTEERDKEGKLLPDKVRLTAFGKKLRDTSLDELPELFNILKGDMSIVGPRPLLKEYLPLYNARQAKRHEVKPGLTGLAQVRGRNGLSWEQKFEDDVKYVEKITFFRDWKIVFQTIAVVLGQKGITSDTSVTMEPFTGNGQDNHMITQEEM